MRSRCNFLTPHNSFTLPCNTPLGGIILEWHDKLPTALLHESDRIWLKEAEYHFTLGPSNPAELESRKRLVAPDVHWIEEVHAIH